MESSKQVWNYFIKKGLTEYATAGILGNMCAESGCDPRTLQSSYVKKLGMTSEEYIKCVDSGTYADFGTDRAGFGLVQFTHPSLKQPLAELAKKNGKSIADLTLQLDFLWDCASQIMKLMCDATSIKEASDIFMLKFEKPSNQSEEAKNKRARFAENYYNVYKGDDNMAVKIGSARSSFGNIAAGDQNGGKEVSTQDWYLHQKGWYVFRAKDAKLRQYMAEAMQKACNNNDIGYDQGTRLTLFNNVKSKDYDPSKTTKKVNTDCSALVRVCIYYALVKCGYSLEDYAPSNFLTSTLETALMRTGLFEKITDDKHCKQSNYLAKGDILNTRTKGHVVIVLSDGAKCDAKNDVQEAPIPTTTSVMHSVAKVNIRTNPQVSAEIVGVVPFGANVNVLEKTEDGWLKVDYDGKIGYCSNRLNYFEDGNVSVKQMTVFGGKLNVRKSYNIDATIIRILANGEKVNVYEEKNGFAKIGDGEWCSMKYLK